MSEKQKMVIVVTNGLSDERSSVAWSVANGAIATGFEVTMFLVSSGVDSVRKGAANGRFVLSRSHFWNRTRMSKEVRLLLSFWISRMSSSIGGPTRNRNFSKIYWATRYDLLLRS